jgi:methylglyoxal synthase
MKNKTIALVAHDNKKADLVNWVAKHSETLKQYHLVCTGTTGKLVLQKLQELYPNDEISLKRVMSGPLGGDQQIGGMIAEGGIHLLIFLWDPMMPQPHEVDIKALLRLSVLYEIPCASTLTTADCIITSPYFLERDFQQSNKFDNYLNRKLSL